MTDSWYERAKRSGEAARDTYDRDTVEYELALYLLRALRELDRARATHIALPASKGQR